MRGFLGMILGALLLVAGVYIYDSQSTSTVANGQTASANRTIVNWDVAATDWNLLKRRAQEDWVKLSSQELRNLLTLSYAPSSPTRAFYCLRPLFVRRRLPRIGNDLIELRHGQDARHAKFPDDEGRRALEAERQGLIAVARDDGVDRLGIGGEVACGAVDIDPRSGEQFANSRLGQF